MIIRVLSIVLIAMLVLGGVARAAEISVHTVTGDVHSGSKLLLNGDKLSLADSNGKAAGSWPLLDIDAVDLDLGQGSEQPQDEAPAQAAQSRQGAYLIGGKLFGSVNTIDLEGVTLQTPTLGEIKLPLAAVRAVQLSGDKDMTLNDREIDGDVLVLSNGDRVPGGIEALTADKVTFSSVLGDMELERDRVTGLLLMPPSGGRAAADGFLVRVMLSDGSSMLLKETSSDGAMLAGRLIGGDQITIPLARVVRLEMSGGRLLPLETLEVAEYEQHSVDLLTWSVVRGRNVLNGPMRLNVDGREDPVTFDRGLGVHGPCRLMFNLGGQYEKLLGLVGIDESAGNYADVNIVVKVDGNEVFRADKVKWREAARQLKVDLAGARKLELIVEAGEHYDVQDRVNWADVRLLKVESAK